MAHVVDSPVHTSTHAPAELGPDPQPFTGFWAKLSLLFVAICVTGALGVIGLVFFKLINPLNGLQVH